MALRLEDLKPGARVLGLVPGRPVDVVAVQWHGGDTVELTYRDGDGRVANTLIYRHQEPDLGLEAPGPTLRLRGDGELLRLVFEARRIRLAWLFDPYVAVHTSLVEPLPHQITGVYGEMLPRQPLRFLLADDPGAGKTIMTGLYIKELMIRGDLKRCLIVSPGNLVEQWQDELRDKFGILFEILTNDMLEAAATGNAFAERDLLIARLDKLARDERAQDKLRQTDWDLVVCDEAHKMSASFFGGEVKPTKRFKLGRLLGGLTRHFLLLTATPHNGKEEDFQLFLSLLDADRFEGRFREGVHRVDVSDLMRRMVKEQLVRFDGTPLFPERRAYTVTYRLSDAEARLYHDVTSYVREEFNRAEALESEGRKGTVGFALTILQRRLASSPEAIYQSLRRRRERLERRLREARLAARVSALPAQTDAPDPDELEELPEAELETLEDQLVDQATAARTVEELQAEIRILRRLEEQADAVRRSGRDRKWEELSRLLQSRAEMFDREGARRKLIIFTEHRDTLEYLRRRVATLLGKPDAVVTIHGGMPRDERRRVQELFTQDPGVHVLVATDAAGEGINLQRAHLLINYDLPWNPNRIEQRFGRIHRIGQTEVCHMWNLVAEETREGDVYLALLRKLEREREALKGAVFDVLGRAISGKELRELLVEAIRYGERPEVRARLKQRVEGALDRERLKALIEERALSHTVFGAAELRRVREEMERMEARRLQPHYVEAFFLAAFRRLGGSIHEREPRRYEITHVPAVVRNRDREIGRGSQVLRRYERICFEKGRVAVPGKPLAEFVAPGHPLLEAVSSLLLDKYQQVLQEGAILVDEADDSADTRVLACLEHTIEDGRTDSEGRRRIASRRIQFVEIDERGQVRHGGPAPYLDYRAATEKERLAIERALQERWAARAIEDTARSYAIQTLAAEHLKEVRMEREARIEKVRAAVRERLQQEIAYWDRRAVELAEQERAGRPNARLNSAKARARADELQSRLERRLRELDEERQLYPLPPAVLGHVVVVTKGLLDGMQGIGEQEPSPFGQDRAEVERLAMEAVMAAERALGMEPRDVSAEKCGYDVESRDPETGRLRFIEVKGRAAGAPTVTITKNEILTALNKPDAYVLALVQVNADGGTEVRYVREPFGREPDFGVTSVNYEWRELWGRGEEPAEAL